MSRATAITDRIVHWSQMVVSDRGRSLIHIISVVNWCTIDELLNLLSSELLTTVRVDFLLLSLFRSSCFTLQSNYVLLCYRSLNLSLPSTIWRYITSVHQLCYSIKPTNGPVTEYVIFGRTVEELRNVDVLLLDVSFKPQFEQARPSSFPLQSIRAIIKYLCILSNLYQATCVLTQLWMKNFAPSLSHTLVLINFYTSDFQRISDSVVHPIVHSQQTMYQIFGKLYGRIIMVAIYRTLLLYKQNKPQLKNENNGNHVRLFLLSWLYQLPPRSECDLYYVNRDTLFSYHKESEIFLQQMMALYVSSHYKNSPNDLQLMADAPAHHLFVLLGPVDESNNKLPYILCVIQVSLEGQISRKSSMKSLSQGHSPYGDQIPWKFCEQFHDTVFPSLSGARIVRIAVHPSAMRLGYGSTAVELLTRYYEGQLTPITELEDMEEDVVEGSPATLTEAAEKVSLLEEKVKPRQNLPPLFVHPRERKPEKLHYLGVSFGMIFSIPTAVTGEHTCMVIKPLNNDDVEVNNEDEWGFFTPFYQDFRNRFIELLGSSFQKMDYRLCMSILDPKIDFREADPTSDKYLTSLDGILTAHDMKRLETYTNNQADFHLILDLLPKIAYQYFQERIPVSLTITHASILLSMGLKNQDLSYMEREMTLERQQILSQFIKSMKKLYNYLYNVAAEKIEATLPQLRDVVMTPHSISVEDDLNAGAKEVKEKMKSDSEAGLLNPELLQKYVITDGEVDFTEALQNGCGKLSSSGVISVKSNRGQSEKREKSSSKGNQKSKEKKHDKSGGFGSKRKRRT
ncbi:hypothetical protein ACHQM5_019886 [Ranunculus cassubicifolius]